MGNEWTNERIGELTDKCTCERLVASPTNKSMIPWTAWGNRRIWCLPPIHRKCCVPVIVCAHLLRANKNRIKCVYVCAIQTACAFLNSSDSFQQQSQAKNTFVFDNSLIFRQNFPLRIDAKCTFSMRYVGEHRDHSNGENSISYPKLHLKRI